MKIQPWSQSWCYLRFKNFFQPTLFLWISNLEKIRCLWNWIRLLNFLEDYKARIEVESLQDTFGSWFQSSKQNFSSASAQVLILTARRLVSSDEKKKVCVEADNDSSVEIWNHDTKHLKCIVETLDSARTKMVLWKQQH